VGTSALALLWLVSTFHLKGVPRKGASSEYTHALRLARRLRFDVARPRLRGATELFPALCANAP
jgi:hypothetical protein